MDGQLPQDEYSRCEAASLAEWYGLTMIAGKVVCIRRYEGWLEHGMYSKLGN
jgi:hypothetical protein